MTDEEYLAKLRTHWKTHRSFPSLAKLSPVLGLSSTSSVFALLGRLEKAGYVERVDGRLAPTRRFFARALLGSVRAGAPAPATQEAPEVIDIDEYLVSDPNRTLLVTVKGDSMKDVGLMDGDIAIVETKRATRSGDVVVARIDGELTVKTLRDERGEFVLEPANAAYKPIRPKESLEIVGVVTGSFRRFKQSSRPKGAVR